MPKPDNLPPEVEITKPGKPGVQTYDAPPGGPPPPPPPPPPPEDDEPVGP